MSREERHRRAAELFLVACGLDDPARREYLDRECANDPTLRDEVLLLLEHDAAYLTHSGIGTERSEAGDASELTGSVGPYTILRLIARGGMGEVYEARQDAPVKRRVAIKVIRADLRSRQVAARFEAEREALALMHHPNVASVHDAGSTTDGRPYIVIEFVEGCTLTEYCDRERLDLTQRIRLFLAACAGVRHAHQRGVIHRDLKPSNVLVTDVDGNPVPKVIDFGIAKALEQPLTEQTLETRLGALIGTPEYMSPEQARGGAGEVDTRSDVYALGVMLHELLVGVLPFPPDELRASSLEEMLRRIRSEEPARPSTRYRTLDPPTRESIATRRDSNARTLESRLRGELDWIVLKSLEKDRERRYASIGDLQDDLGRYLDHRPVQAGPPGGIYRARKFVRRHRLGLGFAAVLVVLLVGFVATTVVQLRAQTAERRRAELAATRAEMESRTRGRVIEFMQGVFRESRADRIGKDGTVEDALKKAAEDALENLEEEPEARAAIHEALGIVYRDAQNGQSPEDENRALFHLERAFELRREALGERDPDTGRSYLELANLAVFEGRFDDAEQLARQALSIFREHGETENKRSASALNTLGLTLRILGRYAEAVDALEESVAFYDAIVDPTRLERGDRATARESLAGVYRRLGRYVEAETLMRQVLQSKREFAGGTVDGGVATAAYNLAAVIDLQGRHAEAEALFRQVFDWEVELNGGEISSWNSITLGAVAGTLAAQARYADAEPLVRRAIGYKRGSPGAESYLAAELVTLARIDLAFGRFEDAERHASESIELLENSGGPDHPECAAPTLRLAQALAGQGRPEDAEALYRSALGISEAGFSPDHPTTIDIRSSLARYLASRGKLEEALEQSSAALDDADRKLAERHPLRGHVLMRRGDVLARAGRDADARAAYAAAEEIFIRAFAADNPFAIEARERLDRLRSDSASLDR